MNFEMFFYLLPLIGVASGALACLLGEAFIRQAEHKHVALPWIAAVFLALSGVALINVLQSQSIGDVHTLFAYDSTRAWLDVAIIISGLCGIVGLQHSLKRESYPGGEPYALMLLASVGAMIMVHAVDSIALFIGIELASLSIYALIGLRRKRLESGEGLLKYFILGAIFSAVYLYGSALLYGATGTTRFAHPAIEGRDALFAVGYGFMFIGLLFKVGVVPFHFWSPDAYTGAPLAVTGFMASIMKLGGFSAIGVLWISLLYTNHAEPLNIFELSSVTAAHVGGESQSTNAMIDKWSMAFIVLGILSVAIGNLSALGQTSVRRIMAFSSTAHAGYMLLALPVLSVYSVSLHHLWYYLIGYGIATSAVMSAVCLISGKEDADNLDVLAGQGRRHPFAGFAITLCLTSLAGVPLTMGFLGKYMIFANLVNDHHITIAIVGMLLAVVGAIYYFRMVINVWLPVDGGDGLRQPTSGLAYASISCALVCVLGLLLLPGL